MAWISIFDEVPLDGETVWIRVISVYGQLATATYNATNETFVVDPTLITIPVYFIARWQKI